MIEIVARIGDSVVAIVEGPCRAHDGTPLVVPGIVTCGVVAYEIRTVDVVRERVPRRRIDVRPLSYLAASFVVQLALWLVAVTTSPFEKLEPPEHRIVRLTHVRAPDPPPPAKPPPPKPHETPTRVPAKPAGSSGLASMAHHDAAHADDSAAAANTARRAMSEIEAIDRLGRTFDSINVAGALANTNGPLVDANTEDPNAFGGGHHFNADTVAPATTYAVERWAVPTFVRTHKGELAPVPAIEWCDDDSCLTRGALAIDRVLPVLERHAKQIAQCYREHTGDLVGTVRVRFPIAPDGKVTGTLGTETGPVGYGTGTVGRCIAKIAQGIRWPQATDETYVFVGLAFRPASG